MSILVNQLTEIFVLHMSFVMFLTFKYIRLSNVCNLFYSIFTIIPTIPTSHLKSWRSSFIIKQRKNDCSGAIVMHKYYSSLDQAQQKHITV